MTSFPALSKKECVDILLGLTSPTVVMHKRPDGDTVGTAIALIRIFEAMGIGANFLCEDEIPERLRFLFDREAMAKAVTEAVCVDVASPLQAGDILNSIPSPVLSIDHHEKNTPFAPHYTASEKSSAAEVVMEICEELEKMGKLTLTKRIAEPLYAAISSDTGRFCYSSATAKTHIRVARLLETGIDAARINHLLFNSKSESVLRAEGYSLANMQTASDGKIAYSVISRDTLLSLGLDISDFESAIDVIRTLRGTSVAMIVKETEPHKFKASLRSTTVDVASVASLFGGGGHRLAAGCTVEAESAEAAAEALLSKLIPLV
jgi:phosphoesterase RecJ-like protein